MDRNEHPIPLLACGPGTGKSRFLQEVGNMLLQKATSTGAFSNILSVYLSRGVNGNNNNNLGGTELDITIGN